MVIIIMCGAAFGFCEFEDPEATLRCMRLLNDWLIADKKLVVSDSDFFACGLTSLDCKIQSPGDVMVTVRSRIPHSVL